MSDLAQEKCIPCESDVPRLSQNEIQSFLEDVPEWQLIEIDNIPRLKRNFKFKNFVTALEFTNAVGKIAEEEGHHPMIELTWGKVSIQWWTHNIEGLHKNDFIMAAKTDELYQ